MATIINADTSDGLKLTSDTSGIIEIQSGGTKVGEFNANGYKPQKPVAFQARCNSSVTVNHATLTKLLFASEIFDTDNC